MAKVSASEFITAIFGDQAAWVTTFKNNPHQTNGVQWHGKLLRPQQPIDVSGKNAYISTASFKPDAKRRDIDHALEAKIVLLDDLTRSDVKGLPLEPTYVLRTSPGNYQAGYVLRNGKNIRGINHFVKALARGRADTNGNNCVRYGRLPGGINTKPEADDYESTITAWNPELRYTLRQLKRAFPITQSAPPKDEIDDLSGVETDPDRLRDALAYLNSDDCPSNLLHYEDTHKDEDGYQFWVDVGMACKATGLEEALDIWTEWSAERAKGANAHEKCARKWRTFRRSGMSVGTIYRCAQEAGWVESVPLDDLNTDEDDEPEQTVDTIEDVMQTCPVVEMRNLYMEYKKSCRYPHPSFGLASVLTIYSAIAANTFAYNNSMFMNIQCQLLGPSTIGKDGALKFVHKMMDAVGMSSMCIKDVASGQALEAALANAEGHHILTIIDESSDKESSEHQKGFRAKLREFATFGVGKYNMRIKADTEEYNTITNPSVTALMATTDTSYAAATKDSSTGEGNISRTFYFTAKQRTEDNEDYLIKGYKYTPPKELMYLVEIVKKWREKQIMFGGPLLNEDNSYVASACNVRLSKEIHRDFIAYCKKETHEYNEALYETDTIGTQLIGRRTELTVKLALACAIASADEAVEDLGLEITKDQWEWAKRCYKAITVDLEPKLRASITPDNNFDAGYKYFIDLLQRLKESKENMLGGSKSLARVYKHWGPLISKGYIPHSLINRRVNSHRQYTKQYIDHAMQSGRLEKFNLAQDKTWDKLKVKPIPGIAKGIIYRFT